jgi:hypothetical protein
MGCATEMVGLAENCVLIKMLMSEDIIDKSA